MAEELDLEKFFTNKKPCNFLIEVYRRNEEFSDKEAYASSISQEIETTYAHAVKIQGKLKEVGFLTTDKQGRKKVIELTESGEEVAKAALNFYSVLEEAGGSQ